MKRMPGLLMAVLLLVGVNRNAVADDFIKTIVFPANYAAGDYVEFVRCHPIDAGASGYYEISISYTRGNLAAAATHLASISHSNPDIWREAGRINSNGYEAAGHHAFTVDCNTLYGYSRFRVRAVAVLGISEPIAVHVKVRSINASDPWTDLNITGNDASVNKFVPMTNDWSLYVGNPYSSEGAALGLTVRETGNVGIGILNPDEKLAVNGTVRAKKVKVTQSGWPDYVFRPGYVLRSVEDLERFVAQHHHLPGIPSEQEVEANGVDVGEMNAKLLKALEEQALYIIELHKKLGALEERMNKLDNKQPS